MLLSKVKQHIPKGQKPVISSLTSGAKSNYLSPISSPGSIIKATKDKSQLAKSTHGLHLLGNKYSISPSQKPSYTSTI